MKKNRNKYYKKYYKKHKKEVCLKLKYWRQWKKKKEQLDLQITNGIEASINTINYFLEKKDVDAAQIALEQLKRQVNILSKMIKKGVFNKCIN